ncbi:4-(cytidine 5'-diphospho)-2-C-methyl-D-erythritol kinase [Rhizobium halophytocola]|uniref:4-diphosphocytidyl-2-C-methyl-D-erythritol kinase n=1 Tax=Rhizobium halophytocola TaxID=735519 RepID=A0ABS4DXH8_9HYPH|nr:4-(cytidine 5'-diphospho)-2-C-methyl-D-erythritol kinase [Rhizobium halophytocola]MBP1850408.1 4-diphosphocytidyl-2-C-methyl-D-erythritol kinase [Rhizobium halophytocola]
MAGLESPLSAGAILEVAPAKVNLALHVTGLRSDGYHLLDSIVTFTRQGDRLGCSTSNADSFTVCGRFAALLVTGGEAPADNLVTKARDRLRRYLESRGQSAPPVAITLEKNLPVAAGIGGGSADAAATLRLLQKVWNATLPAADLSMIALALGADVPMCLASLPLRALGVGETLAPLESMPRFAILLANPLKAVSTPDIFRQLTSKTNPPISPAPKSSAHGDWLDFLGELRNDLETPARTVLPEIAVLADMLGESGAELVRMSGSGATCFGIYADLASAKTAARAMEEQMPDWYFQPAETLQGERPT